VRTLEVFEEETIILVVKERILDNYCARKGKDILVDIYFLTYKDETLKQKRVDRNQFLSDKK